MSCNHYYRYDLATNENGWICCMCDEKPGEPPGFSPWLDRQQIDVKVNCIMLMLHGEGGGPPYITISNGSEGEAIAGAVVDRCNETGRYDQYSIIQYIFEAQSGHGDYWQKISKGVLSGNDHRKRCHCGELSTCISGGKHFCSKHSPGLNALNRDVLSIPKGGEANPNAGGSGGNRPL